MKIAASLWKNPVVIKEVRTRMRGNRAFLVLTLHLLVVASIVTAVYLFFSLSISSGTSLEERRSFGKALFGLVVLLELVMVSFTAPALTAGAISMERERQTFDLLRVTLLPEYALVLGKYFSGLSFILLLLFTSIPLHTPAFLMGGVSLPEILVSMLLLLATAITFCAAGVFFSTITPRSLISTVLSYAFSIFSTFGIPLLILLGLFLVSTISPPVNSETPENIVLVLMVLAWAILSISPLSAMIATEVFYLQNKSIWLSRFDLSGERVFLAPAPWLPYLAICLALTIFWLILSIRLIGTIEQ